MVLLSEKGAHGVSARCEKVCMLLPQRSQGSTLENHMLFIANSMLAPLLQAKQTLSALSTWPAPWNHFERIELPPEKAKTAKRNYDAKCIHCTETIEGKPYMM